MTGDKPLERAVLLQDVAVLLLSLLLAHWLRPPLADLLPGLKPVVPAEQYVHLLLVFLPTWALVAERLDLHRVRTLTGPLVELLRALLWTQAWGTLVLALILVAAQVNLNRSLIGLFLTVSTLLLTTAKLLQRAWAFRTEGEALALVLGAGENEAEAIGRWRGRRVERLASLEPEALWEASTRCSCRRRTGPRSAGWWRRARRWARRRWSRWTGWTWSCRRRGRKPSGPRCT